MSYSADFSQIEKHFNELKNADGVVKEKIAQSFHDYAKGVAGDRSQNAGAAYQLAFCYTVGFGVPFDPKEIIKWLEIAAMNGSRPARLALPQFRLVFDDDLKDYVIPLSEAVENVSLDSQRSQSSEIGSHALSKTFEVDFQDGEVMEHGKVTDGETLLLKAAEHCQYDVMTMLLSNGILGSASSVEGVTALHFFSAWDIERAKVMAQKITRAGGDINAKARKGTSRGGTPLMWSIHQDRTEHSSIILDLGGDPMATDSVGTSALSLCAQLHLHKHLRLLLMHAKPAQVQGCLHCLLVAAASGESRFSQITRHGIDWQVAPLKTLKVLQAWHGLFSDMPDFDSMLMSALRESLNSSFGRSNTNIQIMFLETCCIPASQCTPLLAESITTDNRDMFDKLIARKVPATGLFGDDQKSLLHLCAQNPNNTTTIRYFGQQLLDLNTLDLNARDSAGQTPLMDALLARKWDLAYLLLHNGADPIATTNSGYTIVGLIIRTLNLGAAKWAFRYSNAGDVFRQKAFIVNPTLNISAIQEAARLALPQAHGMKTEMSGLFIFILQNFMSDRRNIDFRSDGILPNASALDIAAAIGNVHAVKALVRRGAHIASSQTALTLARKGLENSDDLGSLERKNLERCIFIIENWEKDPRCTEKAADAWTKLRTIDESNVKSSWEVVAWEWKVPKKEGKVED